jgi:hypothetical protein
VRVGGYLTPMYLQYIDRKTVRKAVLVNKIKFNSVIYNSVGLVPTE